MQKCEIYYEKWRGPVVRYNFSIFLRDAPGYDSWCDTGTGA